MPTSLRISVIDKVSPALQAQINALQSGGRTTMMKKLGKGVEVTLRKHFKERNLSSSSDSKRAARGMPQAGIWNQIRQSTNFVSATLQVAVVSISEPAFRTKLFGIRQLLPRRAQALAIPLDPRVYGKSPRGKPVAGMFKVKIKRTGKVYLAIREGDRLRVMYRLMDRVSIKADPRALPTFEVIDEELIKVITKHFSK